MNNNVYGQKDSSFTIHDAVRSSDYFKTDYSYGSNAITNGLLKTYFTNGFITDQTKDKVSSHLKRNNRLGGDLNVALGCKIHCDTLLGIKNVYYKIEIKDVNHIDAGFSNDLFEVYFRGNQNYAGKTADFSNFDFNMLQYQELKFELSKDYISDVYVKKASAGIGLVNGQYFQHIHANNSTLYTDVGGEFVDANFNVQLNQSDSSKKNLGAPNGYGLATSFSYQYLNKKHGYFIKLSVEDLGFIRWNNKSSEIKADSSYHFEGIVNNDFFNFSDSVRSTSTNLDSAYVQPFLKHHYYKSYTTLLPALFTFGIGKQVKTFLSGINIISLNVNYRISANYIPLTWVDLSHESENHELIKLDFAYGGYSNFYVNASYEMQLLHNWRIGLGVLHIAEMINFNDGRGQGGYVTLEKVL